MQSFGALYSKHRAAHFTNDHFLLGFDILSSISMRTIFSRLASPRKTGFMKLILLVFWKVWNLALRYLYMQNERSINMIHATHRFNFSLWRPYEGNDDWVGGDAGLNCVQQLWRSSSWRCIHERILSLPLSRTRKGFYVRTWQLCAQNEHGSQ